MNKFFREKRKLVIFSAVAVFVAIFVIIGAYVKLSKNNGVDSVSHKTGSEIKAVYLTRKGFGVISKKELNAHPEVLAVSNFASLSEVLKNGRHIAIWIDKSAINLLPKWWLTKYPQRFYPIVVLGYGNDIYAFCDKLNFPLIEPYTGSENLTAPGFSVWMIEKQSDSGITAFMEGYREKINLKRVSEISNKLLKESFSLVQYKNSQYGFVFSMPLTWKGYFVSEEKWKGVNRTGESGGSTVRGPLIVISRPPEGSENQASRIVIFVLTLKEWNEFSNGEFRMGTARHGLVKVGNNKRYIFAVPESYFDKTSFDKTSGDFTEIRQIFEDNPFEVRNTQ